MNFDAIIAAVNKMIPINQSDFDIVAQKLSVRHLKKNEIWEQEGKICQLMGFVNSGILRQYSLKDGNEFTTDFFMENEFIGNYISYQTQQPSQTITEALEPCELLTIPFHDFVSFYECIPATKKSAKIVGDQKLFQLYEKNTSLLMDSPEERYYKLIEQKPDLINRVPQYMIAQYLGIRPESLSRIRKRHRPKK